MIDRFPTFRRWLDGAARAASAPHARKLRHTPSEAAERRRLKDDQLEVIRRLCRHMLIAALVSSSIRAGTFFQGDLTGLANESELVVLGTVREVKGLPGYWLATIDIEEVLKGPMAKAVMLQAGGTADDITSATVGERLLLFLQRGVLGNTEVRQVAWRGRGRMVVTSGDNGLIVRVPAEVRVPATVATLKTPIRADGSADVTLKDLREVVRSTAPERPSK
jgi:hypothetical protein